MRAGGGKLSIAGSAEHGTLQKIQRREKTIGSDKARASIHAVRSREAAIVDVFRNRVSCVDAFDFVNLRKRTKQQSRTGPNTPTTGVVG